VVELAQIIQRCKARFLERFGPWLPFAQRRALGAIEACRTSRLGGQIYHCDCCRQERYTYHSCKNRHCPKCQGDAAGRWLEQQQARLLPVPYFLLTATLPSELRALARRQPRTLYRLLFRCTSAALLTLTRDRKYLGALPGIVAVLHTWKRDLLYHPHLHCLVTGGGLSADSRNWRAVNNSYLVNVRACSRLLRGKFRDALGKAGLLDQVDPRVWKKEWVVHIKPVGDGLPALKYLAPYVFRVAITNRRIEKLENNQVTFRYRDGKTQLWMRCTLAAEEFLRRFLQHVLPRGFVKVRYYGLLGPRKRHLLEKAQLLLRAPRVAREQKTEGEPPDTSPTARVCRCPSCGTVMTLLRSLAPCVRAPP
jgi:hypothetical protein